MVRPSSIALSIALAGALATTAQAAGPAARHEVQVVYMGGNDCPPCVAWRREELPKLSATDVFKRVRFSYVNKVIKSSVPPGLFLPAEVKPLKDKLDRAANGLVGSPQTAIVVDGEVYDYWFGIRSAREMEAALLAIEADKPYPFQRCTRRISQSKCEAPARKT